MPDSRDDIDAERRSWAGNVAGHGSGERARPEDVARSHFSVIVKGERGHVPLQNDERFRFGMPQMAVRLHVRPFQKHVQETMWVVVIADMEVVIHPPSRRLPGVLGHAFDQFVGDQFN